jgi:hypothetical protein
MINNTYNDIGPFKFVPENSRARVAYLANLASERSLDAALRAAKDAGGTIDTVSVKSSSTTVTASWDGDRHASDVRKKFFAHTVINVLFTPFIGIFLCAPFLYPFDQNGWLYTSVSLFFACCVVFLATIFTTPYRDVLRSWFDFKAHGFADEALIHHAVQVAGQTWFLSKDALITSSVDLGKKSITRTVFYDAIGTATVTVEDGFEGVTITGRDGLFIARIAKPQCDNFSTTEDFALEITRRVNLARDCRAHN